MRRLGIGAAVALTVATPQAMAATGQPLRHRNAVVVAWEAGSRSNVVVSTSGRVYVIHSLRRYRSGTRVRVQGIKWGRTVRGIKWGFNPLGIKWGIRLARNGTYSSGLTVLGRQRSMALRGVVLRRWGRRVAISYRGAVVFLPLTRRAVWLPGGTVTNAGLIGAAGSKNTFNLTFSPTGRAVVTGATQDAPAVPYAGVPFAGRITSIDPTGGTIVVNATKNPKFPVVLELTFPESMDLTGYVVGDHVSGKMVRSLTGPEIFVTKISRDTTFAQADDPDTYFASPPPDPQWLEEVKVLREAWAAGDAAGKFTSAGNGLYTAQFQQLWLIERALMRSQQKPLVLLKIDAFISAVENAVPIGSTPPPPEEIDPTFQAEILVQAQALRTLVTG